MVRHNARPAPTEAGKVQLAWHLLTSGSLENRRNTDIGREFGCCETISKPLSGSSTRKDGLARALGKNGHSGHRALHQTFSEPDKLQPATMSREPASCKPEQLEESRGAGMQRQKGGGRGPQHPPVKSTVDQNA